MKPDIEIAQGAKLLHIAEVVEKLGIEEDEFLLCGNYKAKISLRLLDRLKNKPKGKLIIVTAITPTAYGEGKTTVSIGLSMALNRLGNNSIVTLREPSLGPVFGIKGGAAGGGYSQVLPMEDINLHFTGDLHAITSAHNLLSAALDNHIHFGNVLGIDERDILWKRALDMNDRVLRDIVIGLGGRQNAPVREDGFIITAASEVMAILSLSKSIPELKEKLSRILVAFTSDYRPITARDLGVCGAMAVLLKDALKPNLVQTIENTPAFIHTGPFANIAHGTNSILATEMSLKLSDYVVTETGFGSDLGAEKFVDIVTPYAGFYVDGIVLVASIRALKLHGGAPERELSKGNATNVKKGLPNLFKHIENLKRMGIRPVVALNLFPGDNREEIRAVEKACKGLPFAKVRTFEQGSEGAVELAEEVIKHVKARTYQAKPLYDWGSPIEKKIGKIAYEVYGADRVVYTPKAEKDIKRINSLGYEKLPVCIAKTPRSLSDDSKLFGVPKGFKITIRGINISAGAGYLVPIAGEINLLPGLPRNPSALRIDVDDKGRIMGLF